MLRYPADCTKFTVTIEASPNQVWGGTLDVVNVVNDAAESHSPTSTVFGPYDVTSAVRAVKTGGVNLRVMRGSGSGSWSVRMVLRAFQGAASVAEDKSSSDGDVSAKFLQISFRPRE